MEKTNKIILLFGGSSLTNYVFQCGEGEKGGEGERHILLELKKIILLFSG